MMNFSSSFYFWLTTNPCLFQKPVRFPHFITSDCPHSVFQSFSISRWHFLPSPFLSWWQKRHSKGCNPIPNKPHNPSSKNVHPFSEKISKAIFPSFPLKAGERTLKSNSGEISSIIRSAYPASAAFSASSTVYQPGQIQ